MGKTKDIIKEELKGLKFKNFIFLTIAGIINAFGVTCFLYPVKLYDSGVSGLSMLLDQVTPSFLPMSVFLIVINFPIFIFGLKRQGILFTIYSIFAILIYSIFSYLISYVFPIDVNFMSPLAGTDLLLCALFGGLISGIGSGLTIRFGGAIDGLDVLSVVFAKKIGISIGTFSFIFNIILYIICGIVINSWQLPLYSIVTYFVGSQTINYITEGFDRSKCAMIVTSKPREISDALSLKFKAGGTIVDAIGGYSKDEKHILYFIINRFQISNLKEIVHGIDDEAFISLHDVSDIIHKPTKAKKVEENIAIEENNNIEEVSDENEK